jgi:hypothetical protein
MCYDGEYNNRCHIFRNSGFCSIQNNKEHEEQFMPGLLMRVLRAAEKDLRKIKYTRCFQIFGSFSQKDELLIV